MSLAFVLAQRRWQMCRLVAAVNFTLIFLICDCMIAVNIGELL
jgi:hypothetical protein